MIEIGQVIGQYRVSGRLGAGGMGEVYRAKDLKLQRDVALKVLPSAFASDLERIARFEREARLLAALNHPHIASIYGLEESGSTRALVLELVEGPTLADSLASGSPLPIDRVLTVAGQIVDALEAAHERGIVHRDLKPANIKITPDHIVKVLDFGLAKALDPDSEHLVIDQTHSPTVTSTGTKHGVILGTAAYMSPEQARGQPVDKRADIWAFGCVVFEMLTGRSVFAGPTASDTIAAVLTREPDWRALPPATSTGLKRLLRRCLDKDAKHRLRDIGDARADLEPEETSSAIGQVTAPRPTLGASFWSVSAIAAIALAAAVFVATSRTAPRDGQQTATLGGRIEQLTFDAGLTDMPALSPDGKLLAYASDRAGRGDLDIWIQQMAGGAPLRISNDPTDDQSPSFSPDGSQIVFRSERENGGIYVVSSLGGDARRIAPGGRSPRFSPDGKRIAYWTGSWRGQASGSRGQVYVQPLDGNEPVRLLAGFAGAREPVWAPDGSALVVVGRQDAAAPLGDSFDLWFVPLNGRPPSKTGVLDFQDFRRRVDDLQISTNVLGTWTNEGLLISLPGGIWSIPISVATGRLESTPRRLTFGAGLSLQPAASQDGRQLVYAAGESPRVIERSPLNDTDPAVILYSDARVGPSRPSQTPDGSQLIYERSIPGGGEIWLKTVAGGPDRLITTVPAVGNLDSSLSPDGKRVAYTIGEGTDQSLGFVIDTGGGVAKRVCEQCALWGFLSDSRRIFTTRRSGGVVAIDVVTSYADEVLTGGQFGRVHASPDDKWVAFQQRGRLLVAPVRLGQPAPSSTWMSIDDPAGAGRPCGWSPDSKVVYLLQDTDGFRCLWAQRLDERTGQLTGKPYAVRHFHNTVVQEFSTSYGNAISPNGFLYGGGRLRANLWRLLREQ